MSDTSSVFDTDPGYDTTSTSAPDASATNAPSDEAADSSLDTTLAVLPDATRVDTTTNAASDPMPAAAPDAQTYNTADSAADPAIAAAPPSTPDQDSWLHQTLGIDLSAYASAALDPVSNTINDVADGASAAYDTATNAVSDAATTVADGASEAYDTAANAVSDVATTVVDDASAVYDTAANIVSDASDVVSNAASAVSDTASQVASAVMDFGSSVAGTIAGAASDLAYDLSSAASSAVNAANSGAALADLAAGSGATGDGPPAAAGGVSVAGLITRVKQMKALSDDYDKLGADIEDEGHHWYKSDDTDLIASGKAMRDVAKAITDLTVSLNGWAVNVDESTIQSSNNAISAFGNLLNAADMIVALKQSTIAVDQLKDKTNQQTVDAWADSITNTFDKASSLIGVIPDEALPKFIKDYYQGLFSAPKNYVSYFRLIMKKHYAYIDQEGNVPTDPGRPLLVDPSNTIVWEGALCDVYNWAHLQPALRAGFLLTDFMKTCRLPDGDGIDLWLVSEQVGREALAKRIMKYVIGNDAVRDQWIKYVSG